MRGLVLLLMGAVAAAATKNPKVTILLGKTSVEAEYHNFGNFTTLPPVTVPDDHDDHSDSAMAALIVGGIALVFAVLAVRRRNRDGFKVLATNVPNYLPQEVMPRDQKGVSGTPVADPNMPASPPGGEGGGGIDRSETEPGLRVPGAASGRRLRFCVEPSNLESV